METFKFWRENKVANEFSLTGEEFKEQFLKWCESKDPEWLSYYGCAASILVFISDKQGLNSVDDKESSGKLPAICKEAFWGMLKTIYQPPTNI